MKSIKLFVGLLIILLLVSSVHALSSEDDLVFQQKSWFQKLFSLPFVVSGSTSAVPGEAKTYYEVVDNYVLGGYCKVGTVQKARMIMYDPYYNIISDSGVLTQKTSVVGADAYSHTFTFPFLPNEETVRIVGKVYCQKSNNSWGWITDPHSKSVLVLSNGCQSTGCPKDGCVGVKYCYDTNVYQNYRTYTCGNDGMCHSRTTKRLVLNCVGMNEKCNLDTGDSCVNPNYCYSNSDCHSPYYSNEYCLNGNVVRDYYTFYCNNHRCSKNTVRNIVDSCGVHEVCESGSCVEQAYCGDGVCNNNEDYVSCPVDCKNPAYCGNGACDVGESYTTCPSDCEGPVNNESSNNTIPNPGSLPSPSAGFFLTLLHKIFAWLNKIFSL